MCSSAKYPSLAFNLSVPTHGIVTAIDAYALSENYELVEGEWIFQLIWKDELLVEQRFMTYVPAENMESPP